MELEHSAQKFQQIFASLYLAEGNHHTFATFTYEISEEFKRVIFLLHLIFVIFSPKHFRSVLLYVSIMPQAFQIYNCTGTNWQRV